MKQVITVDELSEKFERQEERVLQLVRIIAATNKRMTELTVSMDKLKREETQ